MRNDRNVMLPFDSLQLLVYHELDGGVRSQQQRREETTVQRFETFFSHDSHYSIDHPLVWHVSRHLYLTVRQREYHAHPALQLETRLQKPQGTRNRTPDETGFQRRYHVEETDEL